MSNPTNRASVAAFIFVVSWIGVVTFVLAHFIIKFW